MPQKLTLTYPLFRRRTASNELEPLGYLADGAVIEVTDIVVGKAIDNNSTWYKADDGLFYWSGGIDTVEFVFPNKSFIALPVNEQQDLAVQAMYYYYGKLSEKVTGFTGMSVTFKNTQGHFTNHYALVIQVEAKNNNAAFTIPETLPYYGWAIPTDVVEASVTESSGLGDALKRKRIPSTGSAGFITTKNNGDKFLLVTNYHVACSDLLRKRKLSMLAGDAIEEPAIVMPANTQTVIGRVVEGRLDQFNDLAIIELNDDIQPSNNIMNIGEINGIRKLDNLKENFRPNTIAVKMFGAKTRAVTESRIISCNACQTIRYLGGEIKHQLCALIQTTVMSQPGDSGSAVVDTENRLVGLLVAADNTSSYVLPIENILHNFNLSEP